MPELLHPGVYVLEVPPAVRPIEGVSTSTAAFIGVADKGPTPGRQLPTGRAAQPVMTTSFTDYERQFGGFREDSFLTYAAQAFFNNGGRRLYIVRVAPNDSTVASLGGVASPPAPPLPGVASPPAPPVGISISAKTEGNWGNQISISITDSSDASAQDPDPNAAHNFKLNVYYNWALNKNPVETYDNVAFEGSPNISTTVRYPAESVLAVVNDRSEYIYVTGCTQRPATSPVAADGSPIPVPLTGGNDGSVTGLQSRDFVGLAASSNTVSGTGLHALDKLTDVNLIAIPGWGDAATVNSAMAYCKTRLLQDCFFIGDIGTLAPSEARRDGATPQPGTIDDVRKYVIDPSGFNNVTLDRSFGDFGALYYPWVWTQDPLPISARNPRILLPPSGFVTGLYARIDNSRGVFKAPAGTEAGLAAVMATASTVGDADQDRLNPISVNTIRAVPTAGIVVWGARTIGSDPGWRYVPVRRMAIFLRVSIYYGIQWAVFEPNDEPLWASLRLNIRAFMLTQFRAGAFQGSKPDDAFFVKCDSSTTTQTDIDNGIVNILVGFAPLKPAEFIVLRLSQKVNQTDQ